jgi:peptidoglycan/LPS O-acetylase OafA/YrhL
VGGTQADVRQLEYRAGLDGVRALAVGVVVLYHGGVGAFAGGFVGVDVFFVLSGFLITSLLLHEHAVTGTIDLARFWLGRVRRLVPASLLVIAVSLLLLAVFSSADLPLLRGDAIASIFQVNNWHQVFTERSYFEAAGRPSLLQHYWSLAVEEQFYLVWPPVLLFALTRLRRPTIGLACLGVAVASVLLMRLLYDPGSDPTRIYYGTDTRAMPLLAGVLLAFVWPVMRRTRPVTGAARVALDVAGLVGLALVLAAVFEWTDYMPVVYQGGLSVLALGAVLLIASAAHPSSTVGRVLGVEPLRWIGRRSYGIYLWHWPVMAMTRADVDVRLSAGLLLALQVAATLLVADLSYRYVEMPIRRREARAKVAALLARLRTPQRRLAVGAVPVLLVAVLALLFLWPVAGPHVPGGPSASAQASAEITPGATPISATTPTPPTTATTATVPTTPADPADGPILTVGASVMLEAISALQDRLGATVDAEDSRQPEVILERLREYRDAGQLPPVVVVQTGENGPLTGDYLAQLRDVLKDVPRVVIMNLRYPGESWIDDTNEQLEQLVAGWPQATLADWRSASDDPSLLWDGTHPNERGDDVYADVIAHAIGR